MTMAEIKKRKTRMYEPWGYRDENHYESADIIYENDLNKFFADTSYNRDDNKIHFTNKDGEEVASLDVSEFVKSDQIVEKAWYEDGKIYIKFTNGDLITIDVKELIDENEFTDGLQVVDGTVSVLIDEESDKYISVSENGVKVAGVEEDIEAEKDRAMSAETALDEKINQEISRAISAEQAEEARAISAETALDEKIYQEIADRISDVNAEENRAKSEEQRIEGRLNNEITRATQTEQQLNERITLVNDELDAEESTRESNDAALNLRITTEVNDRIADIDEEEERAKAAEQVLQDEIDDEVVRAKAAEQTIDDKVNDIISGGTHIAQLDELIEKLGYNDNETLVTTNEHEVAFGEWNVSNTDVESSGQTVFSVGIGTSAHDRKNAIEVMKDGSVFMWIEGEFMNINKLLGQISHEVYDTNP